LTKDQFLNSLIIYSRPSHLQAGVWTTIANLLNAYGIQTWHVKINPLVKLASDFSPLFDSFSPDPELFSDLASENSQLLATVWQVSEKKNLSTPTPVYK
jgi:hypothetical protein